MERVQVLSPFQCCVTIQSFQGNNIRDYLSKAAPLIICTVSFTYHILVYDEREKSKKYIIVNKYQKFIISLLHHHILLILVALKT